MKNKIPTRFKPQEFEKKWQEKWEKENIYCPDFQNSKNPYYNLMMFPYPSAEGLHVGNMYAFTGVDIFGRYKRMRGFDVFEPIGLDGFGIHSENYAMKVNRHPKKQAEISASNFYRQLRAIGNGFDFTKNLETYDPDYYRWTQWLFVQMYKHGLCYRAKASVNYCPGCKTVLADEQVIKGNREQGPGISAKNDTNDIDNNINVCERCSSEVELKELEQWFFKITAYAEKLLQNTHKPSFNWSEKVKIGQQNWIGKKTGINIKYQVSGVKYHVEVFTTRPDTNFGATFIVLAPEHPLALKITTSENIDKVSKYIKESQKKTAQDRIAQGRKKTGVFTGAYATNQLNNYKMPIYIADFVLADFGTGAVVGVPGHDKRDFEFAKEFNIPIIRVVVGEDGDKSEIAKINKVQEEAGTMINSGFLDGLDIHLATTKIMDYMEEKGWGKRVVTYHLRDWLISRQRYWGAPIPMINCKKCGWQPVPEKDLPVLLPDVENWRPTGTGRGPLAAYPEFYKTKCPKCQGDADRETDVCDTFLDSAWYYLRYPFVNKKSKIKNQKDSSVIARSVATKQSQLEIAASSSDWIRNDKSENLPWDNEIMKRWMPVDSYIGGAEHTVLHLLYTRFVYMALIDWGLLEVAKPNNNEFDAKEPFKRFFAHGLIIKDGAKMSKSKGNVVVPDEHIKLYGADTLRSYLMFLGPFSSGGDFRDTGIAGMYKWLSRVWRLVIEVANKEIKNEDLESQEAQKRLHALIKFTTGEIENLRYNTAIAKMMEFTNWWMNNSSQIDHNIAKDFIKLLAPFAPHMTEELWQKFIDNGIKHHVSSVKFESIHQSKWPIYDDKILVKDTVKMIIQINGKARDFIDIAVKNADNQVQVEQISKKSAKIEKWLSGKQIKKVIFVPRKLVNFVI